MQKKKTIIIDNKDGDGEKTCLKMKNEEIHLKNKHLSFMQKTMTKKLSTTSLL